MLPLIIVFLVLLNGVLYSGVFQSENAVSPASAANPASPDTSPQQKSAVALAAERAETDDSDRLPGTFVPSQGRQHTGTYPLRQRVPFCAPEHVDSSCYASNPPTSGLHLPVQGTVRLQTGQMLKLPPDPGVYDFAVPREAIPHIEEHAGVYVGYQCATDACRTTVERLKDLVTQEISLGQRVVLSPDPDLSDDTIGVASWTRVDVFGAGDYSDERVRGFIKAHHCRFDPEKFCKDAVLN